MRHAEDGADHRPQEGEAFPDYVDRRLAEELAAYSEQYDMIGLLLNDFVALRRIDDLYAFIDSVKPIMEVCTDCHLDGGSSAKERIGDLPIRDGTTYRDQFFIDFYSEKPI